MSIDLGARLAQGVLVCDGAMGTMLHAGGVSLDRSLPELNVSHPELVRAIHSAYLAAGAEVIETNTFAASRHRLARFGLDDRVADLNRAGVRVAREAIDKAGAERVLVAGSISPATPAGLGYRLSVGEQRDAFGEQIEALIEGGVDLVLFETFGSLAELVEAVGVARSLGDVPIVAQMTFVEDGRTLGGDGPAEIAATLSDLRVTALGANCTLGPQGLLDVLVELAAHTRLPLTAQPNAGPPTLVRGHFQYTADPAYFARLARAFVEVGARLVGGCCGTTPAHIEAVSAALDDSGAVDANIEPRPPAHTRHVAALEKLPDQAPSALRAGGLLERIARGTFVVGCEMAPPAKADPNAAVVAAVALRDAGCQALIVGPVASTRAQVSPASMALLVQQRVPGLDVILTATTWDKSLLVLQADLLGAYAFGIRHVLCRTGTPPPHGEYPNVAGVWEVDSQGLIEVLRGLNEGRDYNGIPIGGPTTFIIGAHINPSARNLEQEVAVARKKLAAGVQFFVTPPVFDFDALMRLLDALRLPPSTPLLVGLMPLRDARHADYLVHEVPDTSVPASVVDRMVQAGERAGQVGCDIVRELGNRARRDGRVQGIVLSAHPDSTAELAALLPTLLA